MTRLRIALALAGTLTYGCLAQAGTVTEIDQYPFYTPELVSYSAPNGAMPVAVVGNPFSGGDDELAASLDVPGFAISSLTPIAADGPRKGGHIVLVFNPVGHAPGGNAVCSDAAGTETSEPGGKFVIQAAFCYSNDVVAEAVLSTPTVSSPGDPGFQRSMHSLMYSMLPPQLLKDGCLNLPNC